MIESGTVGIAEYTPEGWRRLREVCGDDPDLCTFTEVQARTARMVRACKARGMPFELIAADVHYVDEMWRWCRREGVSVGNSLVRSTFGAAWLANDGKAPLEPVEWPPGGKP